MPIRSLFAFLFTFAALASDESALLCAIAAHSGEDTPRLAYADYLEEHGQAERARFIRLQIERANLVPHSPKRERLRGEENELLRRVGEQWVPRALRNSSRYHFQFIWERGFISQIMLSPELLGDRNMHAGIGALEHLKGLMVIPAITEGWSGNPVELLASLKNATQLRSLALSTLSSADIERLSRTPFAAIERLIVGGMDSSVLDALLSSSLAKSLVEFGFDPEVGQLAYLATGANHGGLPKLQVLHIAAVDPNELSTAPRLPKLRSLCLALPMNAAGATSKWRVPAAHAAALRLFRSSPLFQKLYDLTVEVDHERSDVADSVPKLIRALFKGPHNLVDGRIVYHLTEVDPDANLLGTFEKNRERLGCFQVLADVSST